MVNQIILCGLPFTRHMHEQAASLSGAAPGNHMHHRGTRPGRPECRRSAYRAASGFNHVCCVCQPRMSGGTGTRAIHFMFAISHFPFASPVQDLSLADRFARLLLMMLQAVVAIGASLHSVELLSKSCPPSPGFKFVSKCNANAFCRVALQLFTAALSERLEIAPV